MPKRIEMTVSVDLDPVPGVMHTEESAKETVQKTLDDRLAHYFPVVHSNTKTGS